MAFLPRKSSELSRGFDGIFTRLNEQGVVPFFGTLLGLVRKGAPVNGDDDLDFAIDAGSLRKLFEKIKNYDDCKEVTHVESRIGLAQVSFVFELRNSPAIQVDIFGYALEGDAIVFPVHWRNECENESSWLRIPTSMKFVQHMLSRNPSAGNLGNTHEGVDELMDFLYGNMWRTPLRKNIDYKVDIIGGKPTYTIYGSMKRIRLSASHSVLVWLAKNPRHIATKIVRFLGKFMSKKLKDAFFSH